MILLLALLGGLLSSSGQVSAAPSKAAEIELRTDFKLAKNPLTTENVWALDPRQPNPHLQRWLVARKVDLVGLKAELLVSGKYAVSASLVDSVAEGYIRAPGPWYQPLSHFGCEKKPNTWFGTADGAKLAVTLAGELWSEQLKEQKVQLGLLLERVRADSALVAINQGEIVFREWLKNVEYQWRAKVRDRVREKEWKSYLEDATSTENCPPKTKSPETIPLTRTLMEPVVGEPPAATKLLARAPVRLWNGLFTIRLTIFVGSKTLNGRFLIDSSVNTSVISPTWLEGQGFYPAFVVIPGAAPQRVVLNSLWNTLGGSSLARRAWIDRVELGGLHIPMNEFLLLDTDFFDAPKNVGSCCDGVLGSDFLSLYPMQFRSQSPAEVRVWPRENFRWSEETPWVEISQAPTGELVSSCAVVPDKKSLEGDKVVLPGVSWNTGSTEMMNVHLPWRQQAEKVNPNQWKIECDSLEFAQGVPASFPKPAHAGDQDNLASRIPSVNVGIPLLSRGSFTFDLPHGRLWFSPESLKLEPPRKNNSGLKLEYSFRKGERVLSVLAIKPNSSAQPLLKAGLKLNMEILQVDGKSAEDMDLWEVEQRLAGNYGEWVSLKWKTKDGLKMAPLKVR